MSLVTTKRDLLAQFARRVSLPLSIALSCVCLPAQRTQFVTTPQSGVTLTSSKSLVAQTAASADLDGDGDLDVVIGAKNSVAWYRNDGAGHFTEVLGGVTKTGSTALVLGDVDGDGDTDLIHDLPASKILLWLNDGKGVFTQSKHSPIVKTSVATPRLPIGHLTLGDVDGDKDLDLLFSTFDSALGGSIRLLINDGKGAFKNVSATQLPKGAAALYASETFDVDGDGDLDVVSGRVGALQMLINNGKGVFSIAPKTRMPTHKADWAYRMTHLDVDADGDMDLTIGMVLGTTRILINNGKGTFKLGQTVTFPRPFPYAVEIVAADFDRDGDPDLVIANQGLRKSIQMNYLRNDGKGTFKDATVSGAASAHGEISSMLAADFDRDSDVDLFLATRPYTGVASTTRVLFNAHHHTSAHSVATIGTNYIVAIYAEPGYASTTLHGALIIGTSLPKPVAVKPFGWLGVNPAIFGPVMTISRSYGSATMTIPVPNIPGLRGLKFRLQSLVTHGSSPASWRLTNVVDATIR